MTISQERYELYYTYRNGTTNHAGPLIGLANAVQTARCELAAYTAISSVAVIPYTAGSFHPKHAVENITRWQPCLYCGCTDKSSCVKI